MSRLTVQSTVTVRKKNKQQKVIIFVITAGLARFTLQLVPSSCRLTIHCRRVLIKKRDVKKKQTTKPKEKKMIFKIVNQRTKQTEKEIKVFFSLPIDDTQRLLIK